MEFLDIMNISHRYMEILNPSTPEKIIKLGKLLKLKKGNGSSTSVVVVLSPSLSGLRNSVSLVLHRYIRGFSVNGQEKAGHERVVRPNRNRCSPALTYVFEKGFSMPQHILGQRLFLTVTSRQSKQ